MQYLCQNGVDYFECDHKVEKKGDLCPNCQEESYDNFVNNFYGSSSPVTLKERIENEK
jgi:hypothetical protein